MACKKSVLWDLYTCVKGISEYKTSTDQNIEVNCNKFSAVDRGYHQRFFQVTSYKIYKYKFIQTKFYYI
jgi:hypothetical protein